MNIWELSRLKDLIRIFYKKLKYGPNYKRQIEQLPFPKISLEKNTDKALHDEIVYQVSLLQKLYKDYAKIKKETDKKSWKHRSDFSEDKINQKVYELYRLNQKESDIIEKESE